MKTRWTEDEDATLKDVLSAASYYHDGKFATISKRLGRSIDSIKGRARYLGLSSNPNRLLLDQNLSLDDLDDDVRQVLLGSILGDGYLQHRNGRTFFKEEHEAKQRDYVEWKAKILSPLHGEFYDGHKPTVRTPTAPLFDSLKQQFYGSTTGLKNRIPQAIVAGMGPLGLLIWYLDDGSVQWHRMCMRIGSKCFSADDLWATCKTLNLDLGTDLAVTSSRHRGGLYHSITIRAASRAVLLPIWRETAERLWLPDCMMYKLHPGG